MIRSRSLAAMCVLIGVRLVIHQPAAWTRQAATPQTTPVVSVEDLTCRADSTRPRATPEALALMQAGMARMRTGDVDGAIASLTKAISVDPSADLAYTERGVAKRRKWDPSASEDFAKAITLNPASGLNYGMLGVIKHAQGDAAGAKLDFSQAAAKFEAVEAALSTSADPADRVIRNSCLSLLVPLYRYRSDDRNDPAELERVLQRQLGVAPTGIPGGIPGGIPRAVPGSQTPPPLPVRLIVGGDIKEPPKTKDVPPVYPPIAKQAKVGGTVILEGTIGRDGKVKDARVLRSNPLFDAAALAAVRQWEYAPTLLNGIPVEVIMTIVVNFVLK